MPQKIDPFIQLNWGWDTGEGGWGEGMNHNLIIHSFLQNKRVDSVISSASLLPASPANGVVHFAVADKTIYLRADGVWYTFQPTIGMTFILKITEEVVKFNGTSLVTATKEISEVNGLTSALAGKVSTSLIGVASGVAPLGVDGKVPASNLPASGSYLGTWNATTNTPTITSGVGSNGEFYIVSVAGTVSIDTISTWSAGDQIRFNGTTWQRIPNTSAISSVNGYTGTVVLNSTDVGAATSSHTHANATTSTSGFMSDVDKTKLNSITTGATVNSSDATLLARANHTGTQAQSTIVNLTTDLAAKQDLLVNTTNIKSINGISLLGSGNVVVTSGSPTFIGLTDVPSSYIGNASKITRVNSGATGLEFVAVGTAAYSNTTDFANSSHTHANATTSLAGFMSDTDKTKLNSIATGATSNSSDATLLARVNHTGTQLAATISDFNTATDARVVAGITGKENTITAGVTAQYWRGDKSWQTLDKTSVGLSVVDNTSDATKNAASVTLTNKTISGASNTLSNIPQSAVTNLTSDLASKAPTVSPTFTVSVTLPSNTSIGSVGGTEISYLTGVSSSIQTQLNGKQSSLGYTPVNKAGDTISGQLYINSGAVSVPLSLSTTNSYGTVQSFISGTNSGYIKWDGSSMGLLSPDTTKTVYVSNTGTTVGGNLLVNTNCSINSVLSIGAYISPLTAGSNQVAIKSLDAASSRLGLYTSDGNYRGGVIGDNTGTIGLITSAGAIPVYSNSSGTTVTGDLGVGGSVSVNSVLSIGAYISPLTALTNQVAIKSTDSSSSRLGLYTSDGTYRGGLFSDNAGAVGFITSTGNVPVFTNASGTTITGGLNVGGVISGNGSSITSLNASNLSAGTVALARLPFTVSYSPSTSTVVQRDSSGDIYGNNFVASGYVYASFSGSGTYVTNLNASNISTGTVAAARLPVSSTTQTGIVQLDDSTSSSSTATAATSNAVRSAYIIASNADIKADAAVTKATPSQLFQSIGSGSGTRTISGGSGLHVLATATGNTTWVFPTPSSTEALALTLELTNGGAYTMTWPSGMRWSGGVAPTLTASGTDVLVFTKAGTNAWRGYLSSKDNR